MGAQPSQDDIRSADDPEHHPAVQGPNDSELRSGDGSSAPLASGEHDAGGQGCTTSASTGKAIVLGGETEQMERQASDVNRAPTKTDEAGGAMAAERHQQHSTPILAENETKAGLNQDEGNAGGTNGDMGDHDANGRSSAAATAAAITAAGDTPISCVPSTSKEVAIPTQASTLMNVQTSASTSEECLVVGAVSPEGPLVRGLNAHRRGSVNLAAVAPSSASATAAVTDSANKPSAHAANATAKSSFDIVKIAVRSGLIAGLDLLNLTVSSQEVCWICREGRKFHVKVTAETPRRAWSPPAPSPSPPRQSIAWEAFAPGVAQSVFRSKRWDRLPPFRVSHITWDRLDKKLGEDFACELPIDLETLTFGFAFNGSVEGIKVAWPPGMKALRFGNSFNPRPDQIASNSAPISRGASGSNDGGSGGSLGSVGSRSGAAGVSRRPGSAKRLETLSPQEPGWSKFLPTELEELTFGAHFNQPVNKVRWPVGLKRLQFGSNFKQVISGVDWPESLEAVTFGSYFNNPVDDVKWPPALKVLVFGSGFNQPIKSLTDSLEEITFGNHFNQPIEAIQWPSSLKRVTFGDKFNQPVSTTAWPSSLTHLCFGRAFNYPLKTGPCWPPRGLKSVVVGSKYEGEITTASGNAGGTDHDQREDIPATAIGTSGKEEEKEPPYSNTRSGFSITRKDSTRRANRRAGANRRSGKVVASAAQTEGGTPRESGKASGGIEKRVGVAGLQDVAVPDLLSPRLLAKQ